MTTNHIVQLTCDVCKTESQNAYRWARIHISGMSGNMGLLPECNYDLCPDCWKAVHRMIHKPRESNSDGQSRDIEKTPCR